MAKGQQRSNREPKKPKKEKPKSPAAGKPGSGLGIKKQPSPSAGNK